jgi:hypothetical protein
MKKRISQQISVESRGSLGNTWTLYSNKLENPEYMDKFLRCIWPTEVKWRGINHLNRLIACNEIEVVIVS